jgi:hypothetical protein
MRARRGAEQSAISSRSFGLLRSSEELHARKAREEAVEARQRLIRGSTWASASSSAGVIRQQFAGFGAAHGGVASEMPAPHGVDDGRGRGEAHLGQRFHRRRVVHRAGEHQAAVAFLRRQLGDGLE